MIDIERVTSVQASHIFEAVVHLLQDTVDSGASVGFLPPLALDVARAYWTTVIEEVAQDTRVLLIARNQAQVVGAVQLALASQANARHRAEVQKLMVHTRARRQGIGQALMVAVEEAARSAGRTLLVLDTRRGDVSEPLYVKQGYVRAGVIPQYARSATGALDDTVFYYRLLDA